MIAKTHTLDELLAQISRMNTIEESNHVREAMNQYKIYAVGSDYEKVRRALSKRLNEIADQGEKELSETADLMRINGITYDLSEWLTISNYATKYQLDTHVVTNWIRRKVIPPDNVIDVPILNNMRMIKDRLYR